MSAEKSAVTMSAEDPGSQAGAGIDAKQEAQAARAALARHLKGGVVVEVPTQLAPHRGRALACLGVALVGMLGGLVETAEQARAAGGATTAAGVAWAAAGSTGGELSDGSALSDGFASPTDREEAARELAAAWKQPVSIDGFRQTLAAVREALYEQYPEAQGRIEIFDSSAENYAAELDRIDAALGIGRHSKTRERIEEMPERGGWSDSAYEGGHRTCIAVGWPVKAMVEHGSSVSNETVARILLHEVGHCLDDELDPEPVFGWEIDALHHSRGGEAFAEVFSLDMLRRMGGGFEHADHLIASYDASAHLGGTQHIKYDISDHVEAWKATWGGPGDGIETVSLDDMETSLQRAHEVREALPLAQERVFHDYTLAMALEGVRGHFNRHASPQGLEQFLEERSFMPELARAAAAMEELRLSEADGRFATADYRAGLPPLSNFDPLAAMVDMKLANDAWIDGLSGEERDSATNVASLIESEMSNLVLRAGVSTAQLDAVLDHVDHDPALAAELRNVGVAGFLARQGIEEGVLRDAVLYPDFSMPAAGEFPVADHEGWTVASDGAGRLTMKYDGQPATFEGHDGVIPAVVDAKGRHFEDVRLVEGRPARTRIAAADIEAFLEEGRVAAKDPRALLDALPEHPVAIR